MSNGIHENEKIHPKSTQNDTNVAGSAYLGDLLVTGYSVFSRNGNVQNMIGKGYTVKEML